MITLLESLIFFLALIVAGSVYWYVSMPKNLPPGPLGVPLLGNVLDFLKPTDQHFVLMDMVKKYGPVFKLYMGNKLFVVLGDYETIHEALVKQGDLFAGRLQFSSLVPRKLKDLGIIFPEGELWKEHRRFALSTLRDFGVGRSIIEPRIKEEIDHLSDRLEPLAKSGKPFDPQSLLTCTVSNVISQLIFGKRFSYDDEEFVRQFYLFSKRLGGAEVGFLSPVVVLDVLQRIAAPLLKRMQTEVDDFVGFIEREMDRTIAMYDKSEEPTNYIHAYLKAAEDNQSETFTKNQLLASVNDLFIAGTDTTATTLRYALLLLAHHPHVQEKICREVNDQIGDDSLPDFAERSKLPYCDAAVMETLRVANMSPFGGGRRTLANTKLMGYDIPEDARVVAFLTNVLHNDETFPDPQAFKPERFIGEDGKVTKEPKLIPFQTGKRVCLGEALARMELFLVLIGLVTRFRFYFPDDQAKPSLKPSVGIMTAPVAYKICIERR